MAQTEWPVYYTVKGRGIEKIIDIWTFFTIAEANAFSGQIGGGSYSPDGLASSFPSPPWIYVWHPTVAWLWINGWWLIAGVAAASGIIATIIVLTCQEWRRR